MYALLVLTGKGGVLHRLGVLCALVMGVLSVVPVAVDAAGINGGDIELHQQGVMLSNPGDFDWWYGCSPTAAGMILGHYDAVGYDGGSYGKLVPGGVAEVDTFGSGLYLVNDVIASSGHVSDFYTDAYLATGDDVSEPWHSFDSLADFMGTSQDAYSNSNGSTTFWNFVDGSRLYDYDMETLGGSYIGSSGMYGISEYLEYAGYDAAVLYNQYVDTLGLEYGFTFADYMGEIDAGRPVMVHVDGHSMYGYGYDDLTNEVLLHDTWTLGEKRMVWGDSYDSRDHFGVTVLEIVPEPATLLLFGLGSLVLRRKRRAKIKD